MSYEPKYSIPSGATPVKTNLRGITINGKSIPGYQTTFSDGTSKWIRYEDASLSSNFDFSTFTGTKNSNGKWEWNQTTDKSISNLAGATGLTQQQIKDGLYKTPTLQNSLNGTRVQQLGGVSAANKIDPSIPQSSGASVDPNAPVDQGSTPATPPESGKESSGTKTSGFGDFVYPIGLGSTKQDVIKFTMLEYKPTGLGPVGQQGTQKTLGFGGARGSDSNWSKDRKIAGTVVLPIPSGISDTNSLDWGSNSMNALDAALASAAFEGITEGIGKGISSLGLSTQNAVGDENTKKAIGSAFAAAAIGANNAALLSRAEGIVINPNMELLFNGPQLRPFTFTFKLSARSKEESKQIISILNFFKRGMSAIKTESNLFLKAPNTFKIQYIHRPLGADKDHPYIGRIKECALQSLTVDYTPEGQYATFSDGVMVSYQMSMQFQELEPVFNSDYDGLDGTIGY
jgi:hypothetical protein